MITDTDINIIFNLNAGGTVSYIFFMNKQTYCLLVYFDELVKTYIQRYICPICTSHVVRHILIFCFEKYTKLHLYFLKYIDIVFYNYIYTLRDITSSAIHGGTHSHERIHWFDWFITSWQKSSIPCWSIVKSPTFNMFWSSQQTLIVFTQALKFFHWWKVWVLCFCLCCDFICNILWHDHHHQSQRYNHHHQWQPYDHHRQSPPPQPCDIVSHIVFCICCKRHQWCNAIAERRFVSFFKECAHVHVHWWDTIWVNLKTLATSHHSVDGSQFIHLGCISNSLLRAVSFEI